MDQQCDKLGTARRLLSDAADRLSASIADMDDGRTDPLLADIYSFLNAASSQSAGGPSSLYGEAQRMALEAMSRHPAPGIEPQHWHDMYRTLGRIAALPSAQSTGPTGRDNSGATHWDDCWRSHHDCAIHKIESLQSATPTTWQRMGEVADPLGDSPAFEWRGDKLTVFLRRCVGGRIENIEWFQLELPSLPSPADSYDKGETMKPHYFGQEQADADDMLLGMCKQQGYVPKTCLLGGSVVWAEVNAGKDACAGCNGPREKCHGRAKHD